jgi:LL-diaminopimelate aminotransferase
MTTPGYPVFGTHARYYGGVVHNMPLRPENGFLPDLDAVPADLLRKAKAMVLNYPNNPTGANATPEFFRRVVEFALRHRLAVISDAAYAALVFEGKPLSFLATPGAKEVGVELHSTSKSFNMTGWRCGFVAGNPLLVRAYGDVKDNTDSGQFLAVQHAAAYAFEHPEITAKIACLNRFGFEARKPAGSFFLYARAPKRAGDAAFANAEEASQWLITRKLISTVPWDDAGPFLRFSVTFAARGEEDEKRAVAEVGRRLADARFEF